MLPTRHFPSRTMNWQRSSAMLLPSIYLAACLNCSHEGACESMDGGYRVCASSYWQSIPTSEFSCQSGRIVPLTVDDSATNSTISYSTSSFTAPSGLPSGSMAVTQKASSIVGRTGYSACVEERAATPREDEYGKASYLVGGRMASMYEAEHNASFRCDIPAPDNDFYVALWTQWSSDLVDSSQPAPLNCGEYLTITNPKLGISADAMVLDRCASCVGVEHQMRDPTTDLSLVNGATIDLSTELWKYLFKTGGSVYDVEYNGSVYAGWTTAPDILAPEEQLQCA